jgi:hypothetical protein
MTVPSTYYSIHNTIASRLELILSAEDVQTWLNGLIAPYFTETILIYQGHHNTIPHVPAIIIESVDEYDDIVAAGWVTAPQAFNIITCVRRTDPSNAEIAIRTLAGAVKQILMGYLQFTVTVGDQTVKVWDVERGHIQYGYLQNRSLLATTMTWSCKADFPLGIYQL